MKTQGAIWALGAMSGTSMDGVDAALVRTDGVDIFEFGEAAYRAYSDAEREIIRAAMGHWHGQDNVAAASEVVETAHAEMLSKFDADLIGFHGQTLAHDPGGRGTHQTGDGGVLAQILETPVAWDFRTADVALGGQGAPLAPFFHHACARWAGLDEPVAFVNLGGVGNITWLDPNGPVETCLAFDTGPANAPLNDLMFARLGQSHDKDGALSMAGQPDLDLVKAILARGYFHKMPPKSLDRDDFEDVIDLVLERSDADAAATLSYLAAACVVRGVEQCPSPPKHVYICGGGRKNPCMMSTLKAQVACPVSKVETLGLDGDMLEAQAFAYLAVRVARGLVTSSPTTTGVSACIGGGVISHPSQKQADNRG